MNAPTTAARDGVDDTPIPFTELPSLCPTAEVTAARALNQEQQTTLEAKLADRIEKKSLRCAYTVDEGLLGGLTVRIGSRVLDGSVRGELESLRRRLVAQA